MLPIRLLMDLPEMDAAVALQATHWGSEAESVIPAHMLFSIARHGGHVLAAMDGERIAGVLVGFLGTDIEYKGPAGERLWIISKRMVVLPDYRNQGLAYRLKMAQRDLAIAQGIDVILWTFDPLMAPNAHLNLRKLGAVCTRYRQDYFGTEATSGGLVLLGSSDRFFVEWRAMTPRVQQIAAGEAVDQSLGQYLDGGALLVNPQADGKPGEVVLSDLRETMLVEIPAQYSAMVREDEALARAWRVHSRDVLTSLMNSGYDVVDLVRSQDQGQDRVFYVLSQGGDG